MARPDPFERPIATPSRLATWLGELARSLPGLVSAYDVRGPLPARTRERLILAVTEVNGCRYCAWIHGSWRDFLGGADPAGADPAGADDALLAYARASAAAGRPVEPDALRSVLPPDAVRAVRATVARIELANLAGNSIDGLVARMALRRPLQPVATWVELLTVAAAVPLALPAAGLAAALRAVTRAAPAVEVEAPAGDDANLLAHLLAEAASTVLANAAVRLVIGWVPFTVSLALRDGRSAATVRTGRARVVIENGVAADTIVLLEGEIGPLLRVALGSLFEQPGRLRLPWA